jgi:hypothetical protein
MLTTTNDTHRSQHVATEMRSVGGPRVVVIRSRWPLPARRGNHANETLGCFSRDWPSVAPRSESEVEVRVGKPSDAVSDLQPATWTR